MSKCDSKKSNNLKSKKQKTGQSPRKNYRELQNGEQTRKPRGTNHQHGTQKDRGTGGGAQEMHGQKQDDNRTISSINKIQI